MTDSSKSRRLTSLLGLLMLVSACQTAVTPVAPVQVRFSEVRAPNKDELARVGNRSLTLSGYSALRGEFRAPTLDQLVWIGIAALVLEQDQLPMAEALRVARFASGDLKKLKRSPIIAAWWKENDATLTPESAHTRILHLMTRLPIVRNPLLLSQLL